MAKTTKDFMKQLQKLEGAVDYSYNVHDHVARSPSPSLNFTFGNNWGLPFKYSLILWGPMKSGKSLVSYSMAAQLQKEDPEAIVVRFDTEMRAELQCPPESAVKWGIDLDRMVSYNTNNPAKIFDRIEYDIAGMIDEGAKIRMIIIDSITGIRGRRDLNADSIDTQQIGDEAATLQSGLKRILEPVRNKKIAVVLCAQARSELDPMKARMNGDKKMAGSYALKHFAEYFMLVDRNNSKEGKQDLLGHDLLDGSMTDFMDKSEATGHKIRVKMEETSAGVRGRSGEFTFNYSKGIINQHEEVFRLGLNRGLITKPNNMSYEYKGTKWVGKAAAVEAIKNSVDMQQAIVAELIERDRNNAYASEEAILQAKFETEVE